MKHLWIVGIALALIGETLAGGPLEVERRYITAEVAPERRGGVVCVPLVTLAAHSRMTCRWDPAARAVVVERKSGPVRLPMGSNRITLAGKEAPVAPPVYERNGRVMVPMALASKLLGLPLKVEAATDTVLLGPDQNRLVWGLPIESVKAGIVIHAPRPNAKVATPLRIQGQANVFEGHVEIQVRTRDGKVLAKGSGQGAMGQFHPFTTELALETVPAGSERKAEIYAFSPSARDGRPTHAVTVPIRLR